MAGHPTGCHCSDCDSLRRSMGSPTLRLAAMTSRSVRRRGRRHHYRNRHGRSGGRHYQTLRRRRNFWLIVAIIAALALLGYVAVQADLLARVEPLTTEMIGSLSAEGSE